MALRDPSSWAREEEVDVVVLMAGGDGRGRGRARTDSREPEREPSGDLGGGRWRDRDRRQRADLTRVNPRWLSNRTRSPRDRARGEGTGGAACVTRETRRLLPIPGPRSREGGERASGSAGPVRTDGPGSSGPRGGSGPGPTGAGLQERHGVDAWRFLLGLDVESFEAGHDVVAAGQPLLPEYVQAMITETIANYDLTDRSVMTASFVTYLRMLMSEVMVAFQRGVEAGVAREREEVLVDVAIEEDPPGDDGTSLMQRTLTGQFRDTSSGRWTRTLQGLQNDLSAQPVPLRNANIAGLLARLSSAVDIQASHREPLLALLVGMQECDCTEAAVGDVGWQISWWGRVYTALRLEAQAQALQTAPSSSLEAPTAEELQAMAEDEAEVRAERLREQEARQRQEEAHDREEEDYLSAQANLLANDSPGAGVNAEAAPIPTAAEPTRLSARALRAWEDWEWYNLLQEPPKQRRRTVLTVTVGGSQSSGGPG